ncbi:hypothetical protein CBL_03828 [Carabus blaptoides fortunei]
MAACIVRSLSVVIKAAGDVWGRTPHHPDGSVVELVARLVIGRAAGRVYQHYSFPREVLQFPGSQMHSRLTNCIAASYTTILRSSVPESPGLEHFLDYALHSRDRRATSRATPPPQPPEPNPTQLCYASKSGTRRGKYVAPVSIPPQITDTEIGNKSPVPVTKITADPSV